MLSTAQPHPGSSGTANHSGLSPWSGQQGKEKSRCPLQEAMAIKAIPDQSGLFHFPLPHLLLGRSHLRTVFEAICFPMIVSYTDSNFSQ